MSTAIVIAIVVIVIVVIALAVRGVRSRRLNARREDARKLRQSARQRQERAEGHLAAAEEERRFASEDYERSLEVDPDVDEAELPERGAAARSDD